MMKVIIIAAGSATRLGKYAQKIPKGLLDVNGKTILERQISMFRKRNITDITIIVGPHKEKFNFTDIKYVEDKEHENHDVLQSLMEAKNSIQGEVIIIYSDILFDEKILDQIICSNPDIGIVVDLDWEKNYVGRTEHPKSEADNVLIQDKKIIRIKKNLPTIQKNQQMGEFVGIMKFSENGSEVFVSEFDKIKNNHSGSFQEAPSFEKAYLTDIIQELIDRNFLVEPIIVEGNWCEVDTFQDLQNAKKLFV